MCVVEELTKLKARPLFSSHIIAFSKFQTTLVPKVCLAREATPDWSNRAFTFCVAPCLISDNAVILHNVSSGNTKIKRVLNLIDISLFYAMLFSSILWLVRPRRMNHATTARITTKNTPFRAYSWVTSSTAGVAALFSSTCPSPAGTGMVTGIASSSSSPSKPGCAVE